MYCPPKRQVSKVLTTGMVYFMVLYCGTSILQQFIKFLNVLIVNYDHTIQKWLDYITMGLTPKSQLREVQYCTKVQIII